jgi:hypothetical protein
VSWRRDDPEAAELVEDCEAFLDGLYAELCESRGAPVPVWAWMNLLAHGTEEQLRTCVIPHPSGSAWHQARRFLACELLDATTGGRTSLAELQRDVLVPIELDVLSCPGADHWQPGQLVSGLLGALPDKRSRPRR